ncbi:Cof-type HAD-IIB family hydrolase [Planococcus sp. ISL-109]|uniref:Cof-type HAD-IIB family hydrolase n=1 Tax=Planococcus sp. ISL-109 TaxID=2819166 RepID=UPI001BEB768F|nr:Cof-type HAD-IIB family hydrolase [Planococcus sp. ISL-109]MBT2581201.1 HAD family phosphatase [Planococcus sp. ISL-109]
MYKMIAIDLDGTLLTDGLTISQDTVTAIQKSMELGIVVTIATGRMYPSAKRFALELGIDAPLITYQGAMIQAATGGEVLRERLVSFEIAEQLIRIAADKNMHLQVYQDDVLYSAVETAEVMAYSKEVKVPYTIEPDLLKLAQKGFTKLLFINETDGLDLLQNELQALFGEEAWVEKSKSHYLEVTNPEANKGSALLFLAQQLGIDRSEIIGIGDNHNDSELVKSAGFGIAMGNAVAELKELADYTSFSNNEEGVLHAINKYILEPRAALVNSES